MTPKEFQKSNLAVELKAGKKRLEDALAAGVTSSARGLGQRGLVR